MKWAKNDEDDSDDDEDDSDGDEDDSDGDEDDSDGDEDDSDGDEDDSDGDDSDGDDSDDDESDNDDPDEYDSDNDDSDEGDCEEVEPHVDADCKDDDYSDDLEDFEPIGDDRQPDLISESDEYYFEDEDMAAIGEGSHGTVYRVTNRGGREFALKVNTDDDREQWSMEKNVLKTTKYRHVVSLHDAFECDGVAYLALDLCHHGALEEYMTWSGRLPEGDVQTFGRALATGVLHLHSRRFLHRDLKPENVLLGKEWR